MAEPYFLHNGGEHHLANLQGGCTQACFIVIPNGLLILAG